MTKLLVLVPFPMTDDQRAFREAQADAVTLAGDMEVHFRSVRAAPRNYVSHADYALADLSMLDAGQRAQEEGFDAVCIDTMSDSGVAALRSVLDIPVIGPGRASMLMALLLGNRFSIVTMWDAWKPLYTKTLADLGIADRCASIRAINVAPDNRNLLGDKAGDVGALLQAAAETCIDEDGAEVILLGSTTMHEAHEYLSAALPVPVINPGPLSYKMAEAALGLGLSHSRQAYPRSLAPRDDLVEAMFDAGAAFETRSQKKPPEETS